MKDGVVALCCILVANTHIPWEQHSMKCVQLVDNWFQGPFVTGLENEYQLHLKYGVDLLNSLPMKFSVANCEGEMETQVPELQEVPYPPSDRKWRGLSKLTPTQSPAWGHLKVELDLQAMMEEDSAPKCRRDLYLAFTQCAAKEAVNIEMHHTESSRGPCDMDSLYEETKELDSPSMPKPEDRNLARLIAKFDSSIEALWNPEDVSEMVEDLRDEESDDHLTVTPIPIDMHDSKQNLFIACGTNITSSIWSSRPSPEEPLREEWSMPLNVKWSEGDVNPCIDSLVALNHNREDSSFTEVIPRTLTLNRELQPPFSASQQPSQPLPPVQPETSKEEEDLLTSARTHFIPIRQEQAPRQHHQQSTNYADGTTFAIPTSLDIITFTRSESGTLYLEDEADMDSPPKYMEFKMKESNKNNFSENDTLEEFTDFVPKFRLSQNEKCCQTEQEEILMDTSPQLNIKHNFTGEEFYFPGDEHLSLEAEEEEICQAMHGKSHEKAAGPPWIPGWPLNWQEKQASPQSWYHIWSDGNGCLDCSRPPESHKSQLRRELSEDGEQLLSDLSSLLDQYGGVLSEINGNKCDRPDKLAEYTINYKIVKTGPLSNKGTAQKERKRRYSSSQRVCSLFLEGNCRRPHCRFSHDMASIPCHFWADASCLKGGKCPFLHGGRPVTL
ncbi:Zinc finger CCCH domain-containing protein 7 [Frankliniella fusca]|uniref:Zinc finger CCCH domain-containing protein 7 n=1 Tax=Frankliniella fusca TaxID=407009 RepID=A0AAE1HI75_9NEOP|nr:Zinc finger CCCH domain-containing protein 7 [Frankliniella fusca]